MTTLATAAAERAGVAVEDVEVRGHIIDSLILPKILDCISASGAAFRIKEMSIGQARSDPSYALIEVRATDDETLERVLAQIADHGAVPTATQDCRLRPGLFFERAGDALFCGETLFAGYRIRSHIRGYEEIADLLHCRVIPLELVDPRYYHLDTCFCPLAPGLAVYYPRAFDVYGQRVLRELIDELIPVSDAEAASFACNAVVVGRTVVTHAGCPELHRELRARGFTPWAAPLSEFVKAGGAAKCLTLRLDGEAAAGWRLAPTAVAAGHPFSSTH